METIRRIIDKLFPPDLPTPVKKFSKWTFIFFAFFSMLMTLKMAVTARSASLFQVIASFLYLACITIVCTLALPSGFRLMMLIMNKTTFIDLDERFRKNGFEPEMPQIMRHSNPFGAPRERILTAYLYLMVEDYSAARDQLNAAADSSVPRRYSAMERVSRMRLAAMTGKPERAEQIFLESRQMLDEIYGQKPEILDKFKPYLDDAFDYYMLAAVLSERLGMHGEIEAYRNMAEFQLQKRETSAESDLMMSAFELNLLYAQGRLEEADSYYRQLRGEISTANMLQPGRQDDLLSMIGQARLFANIAAATTVSIDISKERALPQGFDTSVPFSSEHGEDPDEMASIPFL